MAVESPTDVMASLMEKLKLDDPWVPPRSWDSVPSQTGASSHSHSSHFLYPTSTVSEPSLVRLVMNALQGVESALISIDKFSALFCYISADRTSHRIPSLWTRCLSTSALGNLLKSIGQFGCIVFLLHKFVSYFTNPDFDGMVEQEENRNNGSCEEGKGPPPKHTLTNQAFAVAVGKVIDGYISALNTLSSSVSLRRSSKTNLGGCLTNIGHSEVTLLEVYLHTTGLRTQMEALGNICNINNLALNFPVSSFGDSSSKANLEFSIFPRGGALLSFLYAQLKVADPDHCALLKFLFLQTYEPYCGFIRSWIYDGRISDPYHEFIVEYVDELPTSAFVDAGISIDLPLATIRVRDGVAVPCFLEEFLIPLFRAGQQLQVIMKLVELCNNANANDNSHEGIFPCSIGLSTEYPWFAFPLTFDKGTIETMVLARASYYQQMLEKIVNILTKFEYSSQQANSQGIPLLGNRNDHGKNLNYPVPSVADDSLFPPLTDGRDGDLPDSEVSSIVDEYSYTEDLLESSECSSLKSSEEQSDASQIIYMPHGNVGLEPSYLSALDFSLSFSTNNSVQKLSQNDMSCSMDNIPFKIDEKSDFANPCHKGENLSVPELLQTPEILATSREHDIWTSNGLGAGRGNTENALGHASDCAENPSKENLRFLRTGMLDCIDSHNFENASKVNAINKDQHPHGTFGSVKYIHMNPALNKSSFLNPRTTLGERCCTNYRESSSYFDFTSVKDPCKEYVDKLASSPRHIFGAELSVITEANAAAVIISSSQHRIEGYNDKTLENNSKFTRVNSPLHKKAVEEGSLLPNISGGSAWETLLSRSGNIANKSTRDHGMRLVAALEMPLDFVIRKCVLDEILLQYKYLSKLTIKFLIEGFELQEHLLALRRYHFMEVADWADLFIMSLWHHKWHVKEADKRIPEIQGVLELSVQRSSCEGDPFKDRLYMYLKGDGMVHLSASATGIHSFDFLGLGYRVDWPVNVILTPAALRIYSEIFSFLIQVKLAVFSLSDVWFSLKSCGGEQHEQEVHHISILNETRHKLNHFVSTLQQYVQSQLSQVSWCRFLHSLKHKVNDMMDLETVHMVYLTESLHICFLSNETRSIASIMQNILQSAMDFRSCLTGGILEARSNDEKSADRFSKIDISQVLSIRTSFAKNLKELWSAEMETLTPAKRNGCLVFAVNGEKFEVPNLDPSTTLLEFLRSRTHFKSVKLGCGEGGCGACVVLLSKYEPVHKKIENFSVSSCLTLLCSVNGCSITTSEGLGNSRDGFHPIHQRFTGFHASQCGFCTPGMCMSLFSALVGAEKTKRPEPSPGFSKLTVSEAEKAIAGNLCRCTGYRPIADACKTFSADVDMEDLGINSYWRKEDSKDVRVSRLPTYHPKNHNCTYSEFLGEEHESEKLLNSELYSWYTPASIEELQTLLHPDVAENATRINLVVGNTGAGYYKETEKHDKYIDLRYIPQLSVVIRDNLGIEFGAALSISKVIFNLNEVNFSKGKLIFTKIADHMEKIASGFIRNSASLGGNLVMSQRKNFPSDISTLLLSVDSSVSILTGHDCEKITMEEFLSRPPLDSRSVLLSVRIPYWKPTQSNGTIESNSRLLFETYRAAPRPLGNALPYLNAAFFADFSCNKNEVRMNNVRLAFGAYGTKHATRANKVEEYLSGKLLTVSVLNEAIKLVKSSVVPEDGTSHAAYQVEFSFDNKISADGLDNALLEEAEIINDSNLLLSSGKQFVELSKECYPVGEPMTKFGSAIQASGEAVFVDDIPSPPNCLHGAFIYSTKPLARVKGISFKCNSLPDGVTDVISSKDIPKGGENVGTRSLFGSEPLFVDDLATCAGDLIAVVVAETQKHANVAAKTALVDYDTESLDPPILTVEEAVKRSSFFDVPPFLYPEKVGDFSEGMAEADHKILNAEIKLGSQYYFYMETQTALAIPDEDNCMVVYSSIQCPEFAHIVIARCLGVPEHNVRVITRRVGGGFGGKALKAMPIAAACALAAHKLRRPVRIYLDRKTDMIMAGGRHPMKITYNVGFKSSGKITALHLDILINAGHTTDISPVLPNNMIGSLKKYNWGSLSFDIKVCKTNLTSKSAMRAPGEVQASYIAEAIVEHVACMLSIEVDSVRQQNLHTYESLLLFYGSASGDSVEYTLPSIWDKVARSSSFVQRIATIEQFNQRHVWRKRGISRVPIIHEVLVRPAPGKVSILWDGSIVVEVGGIELGQGLWTKVKQITAYALSSIQCDGTQELVERVRVVQSDTLGLVQGGFTAGSTTSESSCEAVRLCCNVLVERLAPLKKKLQEQMGSVKWDVLILQAHYQSVNLAAHSFFVPLPSSTQYLNYGAAVSEVEINILTGETRILRTDIVYDCGQSMNPAVDLGQIEGAFVQGIGFFMLEEYLTNADGLVVADSTWTYKIPTIDTIPKQFNVEVLNSGHHQNRVLSSKASGEPPLLLAASVHCATRAAIKEARKQRKSWGALDETDSTFQLQVPATMPVVKQLCGLDTVERYLQSLITCK
ncbi:indole-3-acetaldehyde oxidase [Forsythia ovata]|uniref:indole-3-acetaldehyde oxidase n=1 Tax=Forsythia ovata TaxID=205694 RepID=A0ABD1VFH8_9LAMI